MFDQKSGSNLRKVTTLMEKDENEEQLSHLLQILSRSSHSLTNMELYRKSRNVEHCKRVLLLASVSPLLESLTIWGSSGFWLFRLPRTRMIHTSGQSASQITSTSTQLRIFWNFVAEEEGAENLDVSSLVSFAKVSTTERIRSLISRSSSSLIHASIRVTDRPARTSSLACPSLQVLEGRFPHDFPAWLDCPRLRVFIAGRVNRSLLESLPRSLDELWLIDWDSDDLLYGSRNLRWKGLTQACPNLKILRVTDEILRPENHHERFSSTFLGIMKAREGNVKQGMEIGNIKMVSLQKLIIPTEIFTSVQLDELREVVGEVIDLEDYPDLIELEY